MTQTEIPTQAPDPSASASPARRADATHWAHLCARWTERFPVRVTVRNGSARTQMVTARALNEVNSLTGLVMMFGAAKAVSLILGTSAIAGLAEALAAIAMYVLVVRRVDVLRAVPAASEDQG